MRSAEERSILKSLCYFSMFGYPLTKDQLLNYRTEELTKTDLENGIDRLIEREEVFTIGDYFALQNKPLLVDKRVQSEQNARAFYEKAKKNALIISRFPFVRAVMLSGSLSKNVISDDDADIDYFIVAKKNRLWFCKGLLILNKVFFHGNSKKYFCINYIVSEADLTIEDQNMFTCVELSTLIPLVGVGVHEKLMQANSWTKEMLPYATFDAYDYALEQEHPKKPIISRALEMIFSNPIGNFIDNMVLGVYQWRNKRKYKTANQEDFELMFRSTKNKSKLHPSNYQNYTLERFEKACATYGLDS